jgi:hypothetical protein
MRLLGQSSFSAYLVYEVNEDDDTKPLRVFVTPRRFLGLNFSKHNLVSSLNEQGGRDAE